LFHSYRSASQCLPRPHNAGDAALCTITVQTALT